jgi:hypothetical protein
MTAASDTPEIKSYAAQPTTPAEWIAFVAIAAGTCLWCIAAARSIGPVFDETIYLRAGLAFWRTGSHRELMRLGTMPLPIDLQMLPVYLMQRRGGSFYDPTTQVAHFLPWARATTLIFWVTLLYYSWRSARSIAGPWSGLLAAALMASQPVLLGHAGLATTDIAVTSCLVALAYRFRVARDCFWRLRVGVPSLWFAAAALSKASALFFAPLILLGIEIERLFDSTRAAPASMTRSSSISRLGRELAPFYRDLKQISATGIALVFIYCGCDWMPEPSFVAWAQHLPAASLRGRIMVWLAEHLRVFSNAGEAIVRQVRHNLRGVGPDCTYLMGQLGRAFWYYYPVALSIKLSLGLLILFATILVVAPRAMRNWPIAAAIPLFILSLLSRLQIGVRLMFPLVAFVIIGTSVAATLSIRWAAAHRRTANLIRAEAIAAIVWAALAAIAVWPNGICYTNEAWGGTPTGYLYLSDSNYDWGQGLPELSRWVHRNAAGQINVWYFGLDPVIASPPFIQQRIEADGANIPVESLRGRYLAVGTTMLYGRVYSRSSSQAAIRDFLRRCRPSSRTTTFLIYDFRGGMGACE